MEDLVAWVIDNKDWLFSGAGIAIVAWIGRLIFKKTCASSSQKIRAGDRSVNVQAGRDVNISTKKKGRDVEKR